jgi:D-alanyl-D-alanine endopeptidase (penicillin-binding protein 7)
LTLSLVFAGPSAMAATKTKVDRAGTVTKTSSAKKSSSAKKAVASQSHRSKSSTRTASRRSHVKVAVHRSNLRQLDLADAAAPGFVVTRAEPLHLVPNIAAASGATGASYGQIYGLHQTQDPLALKSSVALVLDQDTNEVLFSKNSDAVLPIASLTKLMTATVVLDAQLPMDEEITITSDDVDTEKNSSSRLAVGTTLSRGELLHLALMASENRAAHALGRSYPGGLPAFVLAMNAKARSLGMHDTRYVDPTGLNSNNQSTAKDLATLVKSAYQQPVIRELSTSPEFAVRVGSRQMQFHTTNSLVRNPSWEIGLQKTGYIVEAGRCLVMQARMAGRKLIMVFLDSTGKYSRQADAERVRRWVESVSRSGALSRVTEAGKITS